MIHLFNWPIFWKHIKNWFAKLRCFFVALFEPSLHNYLHVAYFCSCFSIEFTHNLYSPYKHKFLYRKFDYFHGNYIDYNVLFWLNYNWICAETTMAAYMAKLAAGNACRRSVSCCFSASYRISRWSNQSGIWNNFIAYFQVNILTLSSHLV